MNGIHDMGGMDGFGEVQPQDSEAFHEDWEKQVLAATFLIRTGSHVDERRFIQESIPPADYLSQSYFWRWLHSLETRLLKYGFVTEEELRNPEGRLARVDGFQAVRAEEVETQRTGRLKRIAGRRFAQISGGRPGNGQKRASSRPHPTSSIRPRASGPGAL